MSAPATRAVTFDPRWSIGGGINGGHVLSEMVRAVAPAVPDAPHPLAVSAHYVSPVREGPATVRADVVKVGRSTATVSAVLEQGGRPAVVATVTSTRVEPGLAAGPSSARPPELLPVEDCLGIREVPPHVLANAPFMGQVDLRADARFSGWLVDRPTGRPEVRAWMRMRDGAEPDLPMLLMVVDCLPPVTFELGRFGWAPTVQLSVHLRAVPAPGWLRVVHRSRHLGSDLFEEDCEVWDSRDRLVAQGRQLAFAPREQAA